MRNNSNPFAAQGGSPRGPIGANPFQPQPGGAYNYDVQTTYMPEATVPAVPMAAPPHPQQGHATFPPPSYAAAAASGTVPAVPQAAQAAQQPKAGGFKMPFMSSTAMPAATGTIGSPQGAGSGPPPPGTSQQYRDTQPLLQHPQQPQQAQQPQQDASKYPFYNVRRYRPYFDVDTTEVLWRVGSSFIGAFRANFMQVTQEKPDLYGPFWIATTLIFVTAVAGNYANYIEWRQSLNVSPPPPPPPALDPTAVSPAPDSGASQVVTAQWFTDYTKLGASAAIFYGYTFVFSLLLWLVLRYLRADMRLVNMLCIYGYAMTIFIPISLVCIIPVELLRWLVVAGATLVSGLFLLMNLKERIMPAGAGKAVPMLLVVLGFHLVMGLVLKLYFFSY